MNHNLISLLQQISEAQVQTLKALELITENQKRLIEIIQRMQKDQSASAPATPFVSEPCVLWRDLQERLKEKVTASSYDTWFKPLEVSGIDGDTLLLVAPNDFAADWLRSRYQSMVNELVAQLSGSIKQVRFLQPATA